MWYINKMFLFRDLGDENDAMEQKQLVLAKVKQILDEIIHGSNSEQWESNIQAALKSADLNQNLNHLVSAFLYLNCLNQIGSLFFNENGTGNNNPIVKVHNRYYQEEFGTNTGNEEIDKVNQDKLDAIRYLRNSLAHNFGLVDPKSNKKYKFILTNNSTRVVTPPTIEWKDAYQEEFRFILTDKHDTCTSYSIGVLALGQCIKTILSRIEQEFHDKEFFFYLKQQPSETAEDKLERYAERLREIAYRFFVYYK